MATLTELQTQLDDLKAARNTGVLIARHGDVSITYKTDKEMLAAIQSLENDIAAMQGATRRRVRYIYQPSKGY